MSASPLPRKAGRHAAGFRRPSLFLLSGVGLLLLGMLTGVYLFFPAETLKQRIIQEIKSRTGAVIQIDELALLPLLTLDARRISLDIPDLPQALEIEQVSIAPQWLTLLKNDPGAQLQAHLMNGTITGEIQKSGLINAKATALNFELPLQKPLPMNITGALSEATLVAATRLDPDTKTHLTLRLSSVKILGLNILKTGSPGIDLGEIDLDVDGQGRAMKIKTLASKGGDFDIYGNGTIMIGRSSSTSRIKFTLQVRPNPTADESITTLLDIAGKPGPDGFYSLKLSGTLATPILKSGG